MNAISALNGLRHIIAATDASPAGTAAWATAMQIAALAPGSQVTAVHAVEPIIQMNVTDLAMLDTTLPARMEVMEARLQKEKDADAALSGSELVVLPGLPADVVISTAEGAQAGLIVLTSHGRQGFQRLLLGSTAERIVHSAPCAVLVLKPSQASAEWGAGLHFDRIISAYDGSQGAAESLATAVELAAAHQGRVLLTCAVQPSNDAQSATGDHQRLENTTRELQALAASQTHPDIIDIETGFGKPWEYICDTATRTGTTLIILGPHGHSRFGDFLLGSTAERVVRHAHCPVFITARPAPTQRA